MIYSEKVTPQISALRSQSIKMKTCESHYLRVNFDIAVSGQNEKVNFCRLLCSFRLILFLQAYRCKCQPLFSRKTLCRNFTKTVIILYERCVFVNKVCASAEAAVYKIIKYSLQTAGGLKYFALLKRFALLSTAA